MSQVVSPDISDEELIRLCQVRGDRDERPFQELLRRYQNMVWRVCYGFTYNPQDAEDLTQEVFFKVYRNLDQFEGRSAFKTWVYRIAVNTSQNELRRRSRRPQLAGTAVEELAEVLPAHTNVEAAWQAQTDRERLLQAIDMLKPKEQEVLRLKDVQQLPYADIATALEISLSAAKMRVQRARLALQVVYQELEGA